MDTNSAIEVLQASLSVLFHVAGPVLAAALVVGTLVAILQAATQINEMTLTFVPKLAIIGLLLWTLGGYFLGKLTGFGEHIFRLVGTVGGAP